MTTAEMVKEALEFKFSPAKVEMLDEGNQVHISVQNSQHAITVTVVEGEPVDIGTLTRLVSDTMIRDWCKN